MDSEKLFINAEYIKSIERAIAHGVELQKSKLCHQVEKPSLPDTNGVHRSLNKSRNHSRKVKELMLNNAITHAQKPSLTTKSKIHSGSPYFTKGPGRLSNKRSQTCPIRIAELAMPSKRYCIATWRDRYNVLPTNNLEKLKELVKKQKLVATIPEAIQCFKGQKYDGSKVTDERNQSRNRGARKMKKLSDPDDFKIMCAIFAHSVAARLIKPKNVFLSEELENLSIVVADEIKNLLQYRRRSANCDYFNTKLLKEMTAKITLWISNIMDIAHYNMLEAELRVQKKNENIMGKEGNLVTLIDQYTDWQREERPTDLEEEEGPVFDAIDTIVNNVLDICLPKKSTNSSVCDNNLMDGKVMTTLLQIVNQDDEAVDKDHDSEFDGKTNLSSYISYENGVQYPKFALLKQANIYNDSVRDSGRGSEVVTVETQDGNNKDLHSEDLDINDAAIIGETQDKKDTDSDSQDHDGDLSNDDSQDSRYVSTSDLDITTAHDKSLVDAIDDEEIINLNIDETLEEPLDDRKKVKFSQVKTGGTDGTARIGGTGPNLGTAEYDGRGRNGETRINNSSDTRINATKRLKSNESLLKWPQYSLSSTFIRSDIVFQNPNNNILSLVDEKWPDEYSNHVLRPSKSISKSITSLGDIKEVDDEIEQKDQHINHNRHHIFNKNGKYHQGKRGKGTGNRLKLLGMDYENNILDETSTSGSSREYGQNIKNERSNTKRLQQRDDYTEMSITPSKLLDDIRSSIAAEATQEGKEPEINKEKCSVFEAENIKAAGKGDHIDINKEIQNEIETDSDTVRKAITEGMKRRLRDNSKPKFDYRVCMQSAPAWAITSASVDSMPVTKKEKEYRDGQRRANEIHDLQLQLLKEKIREAKAKADLAELILQQQCSSVTSLGQRELRKWCKDLEHTLINLERWTKWIDFWYRQIYLMKQSASRSEPSKRILYEWLQLRKNMNREATLWKKLTCTTLQILQTYTDKSKARSKSLSPILRIQKDNNSVFDVIQTIEEMSMWLHRAIVSTEHIASRCHCQRRDLTPKLKKYKKK